MNSNDPLDRGRDGEDDNAMTLLFEYFFSSTSTLEYPVLQSAYTNRIPIEAGLVHFPVREYSYPSGSSKSTLYLRLAHIEQAGPPSASPHRLRTSYLIWDRCEYVGTGNHWPLQPFVLLMSLNEYI